MLVHRRHSRAGSQRRHRQPSSRAYATSNRHLADPGPAVRPARFASPSMHPPKGETGPGCGRWCGRSAAALPGCGRWCGRSAAAEPGCGPGCGRSAAALPGCGRWCGRSAAAEPGCGPGCDRSAAALLGCGRWCGRSAAALPGCGRWCGRSAAAEPGCGPGCGRSAAALPGCGPWWVVSGGVPAAALGEGIAVCRLLSRDCALCCFHQIGASDPPVLSADALDPP